MPKSEASQPESLYSLEELGPALIVHFTIDVLSNQPLERLYQVVQEKPRLRLVLDFKTVTVINSHALAFFVSLRRKVLDQGGKLAFYGMEENLVDLFDRSRLRNFFPIFLTRTEALAAVQGQ